MADTIANIKKKEWSKNENGGYTMLQYNFKH